MEKRICTLYQVINIFNLATYGGNNASNPLVSTLNIKEFVDTYEFPVPIFDDNGNKIGEKMEKIALDEYTPLEGYYDRINEYYGKDLVFTIKYSEKTGRYTIKNNINKLTTSTNYDGNITYQIVELIYKIDRNTDFSIGGNMDNKVEEKPQADTNETPATDTNETPVKESVKEFLQDKESINTLINDYLLNVDYHKMHNCKTLNDVINNVAEDYGGKRGYGIINGIIDMDEYDWVFVQLNEMFEHSLTDDFNDFLNNYVTPKDPKNVYHFKFNLMYYANDKDMLKYFDGGCYDLKTIAELYKDEELSINIRYKGTGINSIYTISLNRYRDYFIVTGDKLSIKDNILYNLIIRVVNDRYTHHTCALQYGPDYNKMYR